VRGRKKLFILVALLALMCLNPPLGQPQSSKPKLILVLSIDQMRFDYLTRFGDLYKGGFRRLLNSGAVFNEA